MIAFERAACLSLAYEQAHFGEFGGLRWRCSRQRKLANPVIRKGRLNVKKIYLHIRQLSLAGFHGF